MPTVTKKGRLPSLNLGIIENKRGDEIIFEIKDNQLGQNSKRKGDWQR